ncbi:Major membrane immunogen, membrane-anchored lipoprotein, partial [Dysosmobacter welbionis]
SVSGFSLPNSGIQIGVSSKYIDLGTLLDADAGRGVESLEPDIAVPQTMADTLAGRDTAVEWLLAHPETLEQREYPDAPLTRGRFVGLLYAAAGSPAAAAEAGFQDLLGIEWFLPAVNWAAETGVTGGTAEGAFAAARYLTWQEAAVFLVRTVEALGLEPEAVRTAPLPD